MVKKAYDYDRRASFRAAPERTSEVSYDRTAASARPTYPDGRWIPLPGEKVYQTFPSVGGMGHTLFGIVTKANRVKVTEGGLDAPIGRVMSLAGWTVVDDPAPKARYEAEKAKREEAQAKKLTDKEVAEAAVEAYVKKNRLKPITSPSDVSEGDVVFHVGPDIFGDPTKPIVEKMKVLSVHPKYGVENDRGQTYPLKSVYRK